MSDNISSDDENGDCCLKDLTNTEEQFISTLDNHSLPSVRRNKRNNLNSNDTNKNHGTQDNGGGKKNDEHFVIIGDVTQQGRVKSLGHNFIQPSQKRKRESQNMFAIQRKRRERRRRGSASKD